MPEFRWVTKVLAGPWRLTRLEALSDALSTGHAFVNQGKGDVITLRPFASIETGC